MKKIAVITSGFLPVPATKGGAVENLIVNILNENEKNENLNIEILSIYDEKAKEESSKYQNSSFKFIKVNFFVKLIDKMIFWIAKNILKKKNSQSYRYIIQRLYYLNKCSIILKKYNYDQVLLENHPTQFLALKWRKNYIKYQNRYLYHCHNEFPGTYGCSDVISKTEKFICVSQFIANQLSEYLGLSKDKFVVLRNCVNYQKFSKVLSQNEKNEILLKHNINSNDKILLFTGRIVPEKGVLELINSLKEVTYNNFKLLIIGSALNDLKVKTEYQIKIENEVSKISDKVIFTGFVNYDDIYKYYSIADLAVLPSIWDDPAPLTIIESLVSGLPIITTNSGGIPEYAVDGSAIIIKRDDNLVSNLTFEIEKLLSDDELLLNMSKKAKEVSIDLTLQNYYKNFVDIMGDNYE